MQTSPCVDVPDEDALVGTAADEKVLPAYFGANNGFDEVCVAIILASWRSRVDFPGPDALVPRACEKCPVLWPADG